MTIPIPTTGRPTWCSSCASGDEENPSLKEIFADPDGTGGSAVVLHPQRGRDRVGKGRTLGPVGGRIVAEVLVGLLQKDPNSYLYLNPSGSPRPP